MIDLRDYPKNKILSIVKAYIEDALLYSGVDAIIKDMDIYGSYAKGYANENSDLDIVVEFEDDDDLREDSLFNILNDEDDRLYIDDVLVDINPILASDSGDLKSYLNRVGSYNKYTSVNESYLDDNEEFYDYKTGEVKDTDLFDTSKTGMSYYDDFINDLDYMQKAKNKTAKIVMMSPKEYFEEVAKIFNSSVDRQINSTKADSKTIEHLKQVINKYHRKFPLTFIDYADNSQEGRHRMYTAAELTSWDTKFPVMVITTYDESLKLKNEIRNILEDTFIKTTKINSYSSLDEFKDILTKELSTKIPNFNKDKLKININNDSIDLSYDNIKPYYLYDIDYIKFTGDNMNENLKTLNEYSIIKTGWASMDTTQDIDISIKFNNTEPLYVTEENADEINDKIIDAIIECSDPFPEIKDVDDEDMFGYDDTIDPGDTFEFRVSFKIYLTGKYTYIPATMFALNGDPGDPEDFDVNFTGGFDDIDDKKLITELRKIPYIGQYIESVKTGIYEYEENEIICENKNRHKLQIKESNSNDEIRVFMNTWANYNEYGADSGITPTGWMSIDDAIDYFEEYAEYEPFINDTDMPFDIGINEYSGLSDLELLKRIEDDNIDSDVFTAITESQTSNIEDALDIYESGDFWFIPGVNSESDLGYEVIDSVGSISDTLGDNVSSYIDENGFREDLRWDAEDMMREDAEYYVEHELHLDEDDEEYEEKIEEYINDNMDDYIDNLIDELLSSPSDDIIENYFDYEAFGRDLIYGDGWSLTSTGAIQVY